jgi:hypothetical protein
MTKRDDTMDFFGLSIKRIFKHHENSRSCRSAGRWGTIEITRGARFAAKAVVLSAAADDPAIKIAVRRIGPALVFERLWEPAAGR